jgi:hypothetical protein
MSTTTRGWWWRLAPAVAATLLVGLVAVVPGFGPDQLAVAAPAGPVTQTHNLISGHNTVLPNAQVTVSQTENLFNRQKIYISWKKFKPSTNNQVVVGYDPENVYRMEYPVVVLQCRGAQPTKQACFPNFYNAPNVYRPEDDALQASKLNEFVPSDAVDPSGANWRLPFQAIGGHVYKWDAKPLARDFPPDGGSSVFPGNMLTQSTELDGTHSGVEFEPRDKQTSPSLGCSDTVDCSLVVVPILDPDCVPGAKRDCTSGPINSPGWGTGGNNWGNRHLIGLGNWATESNWRNKFVFPLKFAPLPSTCAPTDPRPRRSVLGSEPADLAMRSWAIAFCGDGSKPKLGHLRQSEAVARNALVRKSGPGYAADAVLTTQPVAPDSSPRPITHAPVAATGFAVTFLLDHGPMQRQEMTMRLTPRLLAKLLTQSYPTFRWFLAGPNGRHPDIGGNPFSIFRDAEFKRVNPNLFPQGKPVNTNLITMESPLVVTNDQDAYWELTRYIMSDPEAVKWLAGTPDEQGMIVNPAWKGTPFPASRAELRDTAIMRHAASNEPTPCDGSTPVPYLTKIANTVPGLEEAALGLVDNRPTRAFCVLDNTPTPPVWSLKRVDPEFFPNRRYIAITSVSYAKLYSLPMAELKTPYKDASGNDMYQAPTEDSMLRALGSTKMDGKTGTLLVDHAAIPQQAYPGTFLVYAAVPTKGVEKKLAGDYATFVRYAATQGQTRGTGAGQLPDGYVPLPDPLRQQATTAADAIAAQGAQVPLPPPDLPKRVQRSVQNWLTNPGTGTGSGTGTGTGATPAGGAPPSVGAGASPAASGSSRPATVSATRSDTSPFGRWVLPIVLILGLVAAAAAPVVMMAGQPGHPVRQYLARVPGPTRRWFTDTP